VAEDRFPMRKPVDVVLGLRVLSEGEFINFTSYCQLVKKALLVLELVNLLTTFSHSRRICESRMFSALFPSVCPYGTVRLHWWDFLEISCLEFFTKIYQHFLILVKMGP